jgi:AcrR family transcriptional regulator
MTEQAQAAGGNPAIRVPGRQGTARGGAGGAGGGRRWDDRASRARPRGPAANPEGAGQRGAATRAVLLDAAREVFTSVGFAEASVTDIVTKAGASVGSLYHHFDGKADLYLVLHDQFQDELAERARQANRDARATGLSDPKELFLAGARAYLDGCIEQRGLARRFVSGDGPPGFDLVMRQRVREWAIKNAELFARSDEPDDEPLAVVLTGALVMAVAEVALGDDAVRARRIADGVLRVMAGIGGP